jgi:hypothetical protein
LTNKLLHSSKLKSKKKKFASQNYYRYQQWLRISPQLCKVRSQADQQVVQTSKLKSKKYNLQAKYHCGYRQWLRTSPQLCMESSKVDQQASVA